MEDSTSCLKSENLCKVCGDKASGKHYGVASCDGCRGFFKRSIRRNLEYVCKENGRCIVDVTRRNQCQSCRFKKCLEVNMKRDAVQHERAPRSTQTNIHHYPLGLTARYRTLHGSGLFSSLPLHLQNPPILDAHLNPQSGIPSHYLHQGLLYPGMLSPFTKPLLHPGLTIPPSSPYLQKPQHTLFSASLNSRSGIKDDEVSSSEEITQEKCGAEDNSGEDTKSRLELPIIHDSCTQNTRQFDLPSLNLFPTENIYESAAKLLFLSIKWARTIPSFLQLSYRDQSILLEESWSELFVLTAAQWVLPVDESVLLGNIVAPASHQNFLEEDARKLREIITRLNLLRVDHTEHACLKALVLFKAECRGLCEPAHVELLQDQTHVMLHEYCSQRQNHNKGRFGKLLLTLPAVQSISRRSLEELLFRQTVGNISIDRLLGELAKSTH
ncbi:nuclear receptor subfamily 2 group E member 1-like [Aethina tumida]|uniref:nuclear receptor subfamily 2 group E member 1-like n=1 Tax=Aethina tumida TaxID=116153 RepID=UPI0021495021|nr:nuclear receptor subfamily 2 group E member 1-like [Aethina tumida]